MINERYILICIYGYNNQAVNVNLYAKLSQLINEWKTAYSSDKVILGGDHNIAPDSWLDRIPHRYSQPVYNDTITNLGTITNIIDCWRTSNPTSVQYTWFNSAGNGQCSRLDFWLISCELCNDISKCDISASPLTDHSMISLNLVTSKQYQNSPNIWKFNNDLLQNVGFCDQVKSLILEVEKLDMSDASKWEWFKFEVKQIAIKTGKELSHIRKQKQKDLFDKINSLTNNNQPSLEDETELKLLQSHLDDIYTTKANGAYIRSRARWIEKGEKSSAYFFGLEKQRQTKRKILTWLNMNSFLLC